MKPRYTRTELKSVYLINPHLNSYQCFNGPWTLHSDGEITMFDEFRNSQVSVKKGDWFLTFSEAECHLKLMKEIV